MSNGHDLPWWTLLMRSLATSRVQVVSIEHEDPLAPPEVGILEAARLLKVAAAEAAGVTLMVLGEPDSVDYVDAREHSLTAMLRFGYLPVAIHLLDLPGITRYGMEFAAYAPDRRVTLSFPSPFLRSEPATITTEGGHPGTTRTWRAEEIVSYESAFKRELAAFHHCVVTGEQPLTDGVDGLRYIAICQSIIESYRRRGPVAAPSSIG